jgi:hypothetical protein
MSRLAIVTSILATCFAANGWAEISTDEAKRLNEASTVVVDIRHAPNKGIPEDLWNRAECVAVIPALKKVAFMLGGEYGRGVLTCRSGASWSSPAFIEVANGSWGLQIGIPGEVNGSAQARWPQTIEVFRRGMGSMNRDGRATHGWRREPQAPEREAAPRRRAC